MNTSTRWHKPSCITPHVVVDGSVPKCRACGSDASALLRRAAAQPAPSYSGIKLPPEVPIGQMNLWWPPCVPYTRNDAPRCHLGAPRGDAASLTSQASDSCLSEIYTSSLGKGHFRLLYLSGSRGIYDPIHGALVDYQVDDCPEYETISYTWGGEDGDATPCRPAYFGDFWDVLFLTRNCWSLLQYLRPEMGTRKVWVDAICINQNNIPERGAQVSIMAQIYRNCARVVIYLGGHLVRKYEHRFRRRIWHNHVIERDDLYYVDDTKFDIRHSVFHSRYISRVWIIQELILAPSAVLALMDHDLYLDNGLLHRIAKKEDGRDWLEFMGQIHGLRQITLYEGFRKTFHSQATDPRDRIFGILGILGANLAYSEIVPEYSLSMRDCVIGVMGFTVLTSKEIWPLLSVQNSNTKSQYPSWVPSFDEIACWTDEIFLDSAVPGSLDHEMSGEWATVIKLEEYNPANYFPMTLPSDGSDSEGDNEDADLTKRQLLLLGPGMPWHQDGSIMSSTGALTLRLVRLFETPHQMVEGPYLRKISRSLIHPTYSWDLKDCYYHVRGPSAAVCFATTKKPPGHECPWYLFLAFHVKSPRLRKDFNPKTSFLRKSETYLLFADKAEASGSFKLLGCCRLDDVKIFSASPLLSPSSPLVSQVEPGVHNMLSLFDILDRSLHYKPQHYFRNDGVSEAKFFDLIVPSQEATIPEFSHLGLAVVRTTEPATVTEEFRRAYKACLQSRSGEFNPVLDDEYVWFTLVDNAALRHFGDCLLRQLRIAGQDPKSQLKWQPWYLIFPPWFDLQIPDIGNDECTGNLCAWTGPGGYGGQNSASHPRCGQHMDDGLGVWEYWLPRTPEAKQLQMPVRAKMPLKFIVEGIRETRLHWILRNLLAFADKVSEDAETLLERGPQPEDSNIYLHDWPKSLVDELGFVWRNELVTFV